MDSYVKRVDAGLCRISIRIYRPTKHFVTSQGFVVTQLCIMAEVRRRHAGMSCLRDKTRRKRSKDFNCVLLVSPVRYGLK